MMALLRLKTDMPNDVFPSNCKPKQKRKKARLREYSKVKVGKWCRGERERRKKTLIKKAKREESNGFHIKR